MLINTHKFLNTLLKKFIHTATNTLPSLSRAQVPVFHKPPLGNKGRCFVKACTAPYKPSVPEPERKCPLSSQRLPTALPPSAAHQALPDRAAALTHTEVAKWLQAPTNQAFKSGLLICFLQEDFTHLRGRKGNIIIFLTF